MPPWWCSIPLFAFKHFASSSFCGTNCICSPSPVSWTERAIVASTRVFTVCSWVQVASYTPCSWTTTVAGSHHLTQDTKPFSIQHAACVCFHWSWQLVSSCDVHIQFWRGIQRQTNAGHLSPLGGMRTAKRNWFLICFSVHDFQGYKRSAAANFWFIVTMTERQSPLSTRTQRTIDRSMRVQTTSNYT